MKQEVKRITLTGTAQEITFDYLCGKYLVKNFGDDTIYVSFEDTFTEEDSIKILPSNFQVCIVNEYLGGIDYFKTKSIWIQGTGEVEVQQLCFH